jgi:hypothetical protein
MVNGDFSVLGVGDGDGRDGDGLVSDSSLCLLVLSSMFNLLRMTTLLMTNYCIKGHRK